MEDRIDAKDEKAKYGISSHSSICKASLCDMTDNRLLIIICISCCEFTDKHIAAVETEIKDLNAEMSAIKQTLLRLDGASIENIIKHYLFGFDVNLSVILSLFLQIK